MVDVAVIGAGIAGLWSALELLRQGARVIVLDARTPGMGASAAAGGMLAPGAEGEGLSSAFNQLALRSRSVWADAARDIEAASGIDIGFAACGSLIVARDSAEALALQARCAAGLGQWLDASTLVRSFPALSLALAGAAHVPGDGCVDNRAFMEALLLAVTRLGGQMHFASGDAAITLSSGRVTGIVSRGVTHEVPRVLVAAGAWSSNVQIMDEGNPRADILPPVKPIKGQMGMMPVDQLPMRELVWVGHTYLIPRRAQQLVLGATSEDAGFDDSISADAVERLAVDARATIPALAGRAVAERWCGFRPMTPDGLPVLGETRVPGLYVASGQFRNGILFAPVIGATMAALILGGAPSSDLAAFDPKRFDQPHGL